MKKSITLEKRTENCQNWKKIQKSLEEFREMIALVRKYPIKPMQLTLPYQPYNLSKESYKYEAHPMPFYCSG